MDNTGTKRLVRALAFFERALLHRFQSVPYQNVAQRSQGALRRLGGSRTSLRFRVALQQLRFDWDLLSAESALDPDALRLQLKVLELAPEHPEAADAVRHEMEKVPIGRLFLAVVAGGEAERRPGDRRGLRVRVDPGRVRR